MYLDAEGGMIVFLVTSVSWWPPESERRLAHPGNEGSDIEITAHPSGKISLEVVVGDDETVTFESFPVEVPDGTNLMFTAQWGEDEPVLSINGEEVPPADSDREDPFVVSSSDVEEEYSIGHPEAEVHCQEWMQWRVEEWDSNQLTRSEDTEDPRRFKSPSEQKGDLLRAVSILMDDLQLVAEGDLYRLDVVLPTLRSLLCWQGSHDPLLFRVASWEDLPLPVFSIDRAGFVQDMTEILTEQTPSDTNFNLGLGSASIERVTPGQEIMDFQEWLDQPMVKESSGRDVVKNRDMIREHASTSSLSHYHAYTYREVDLSRYFSSFGRDQLSRYIFQIGAVTSQLGRYVLRETA